MKLFILLINVFIIQNFISIDNEILNNINTQEKFKKAYFASGCFWCVEAIFESLKGVKEVYSGYSGGHTKNPTYNSVNTGLTGHAESVEILYDSEVISYKNLVEVFFGSHDPTTINRQGPDRGSQYRSIAFFNSEKEKEIIFYYINLFEKNKVFKNKIVTKIMLMEKFFYAEAYHQDYEKINPNNSYVRNVSIPRINKFKNKFSSLLKINH